MSVASSPLYDWNAYDFKYYLNGALCGGICCSLTHGAACPIDVVKTRVQLDPVKYNSGLIGGFRTVVAEEGYGALATGLGPTAMGYFIQGWFKFGGFEFFKVNIAKTLGDEKGWENRNLIYLGASAMAETIADVFLCPLEAARIRQVSDPNFAQGTIAAISKLYQMEGFAGWYSGFVPILFKQVPYTMAKFAVQGNAAERMFAAMGKTPDQCGKVEKTGVSLASGVVAGVAAAIISHPADTLLSKINKKGAGGEGSIVTRLVRIAGETGPVGLCLTGLGPRCIMIGSLTAGQFGIFDTMMPLLGVTKFHFHNPYEHKEGGH